MLEDAFYDQEQCLRDYVEEQDYLDASDYMEYMDLIDEIYYSDDEDFDDFD